MASEYDRLITVPDEYSGLVSFSSNINTSSEGSTSPGPVNNRGLFKDLDEIDESRDTFCKRRGIAIIICFAFISLLLAIVVIFNDQFSSIFGSKGSNNNEILYQRYENDWDTLEHVEDKWIPGGWKYNSKCDSSHTFDLTFAVKLQNTDKIEEELMKTSDPNSPTYGEHWSVEEVNEMFGVSEESINEILKWMEYHGVSEESITFLTKNRDYIRVNTDCETANKMLNTEFGFWANTGSSKKFAQSNSGEKGHLRVKQNYRVPKVVKKHLDFVSPTLRFPPHRHGKSKVEFFSSLSKGDRYDNKKIKSMGKDYVTPDKLTGMYCMTGYTNPKATNNAQAIASFLQEWFNYGDYTLFHEYFNVTPTALTRDPIFQPDGDGTEALLDVEYITSTGRGIPTVAFDVEDDLYFITLLQQLENSIEKVWVVSISYGGSEQSNGFKYCNRANAEFGKATLRGISFFVSSGDDGAAGDETCAEYNQYQPSFPATSPYVTAVGGTTGGKIPDNCDNDFTDEEAWFYSGGGFSVWFGRMGWQDKAVQEYLDNADLPTSTLYNPHGRGYPDISALSVYYIVVIDGILYSVSGTSCSSPAVAGMISQINDIRFQNGKASLGWLNPRLYSMYDSDSDDYFNDVTKGYSEGCEIDNGKGFEADDGWDPVTGVGTPRISAMGPALIK